MTKQYQTILADAGIRPSIQRIAVYGYLCEHPVHPDVETVYDALNPIYPTLSKTTVYNTLKGLRSIPASRFFSVLQYQEYC